MCNIMDNKHKKGYLFGDLHCYTIMNTYKHNNPIKTQKDQLVVDLLHGQTPINHINDFSITLLK